MADGIGIIVRRTVLHGVVTKRIGIAQLAIGVARDQRSLFMHVQGHFAAIQRHSHCLLAKRERDAFHSVGRNDIHGAPRARGLVSGLAAVRKAGLVHCHPVGTCFRIARLHLYAIVYAVDRDGHLAFRYVAIIVRIGIGELLRQLLAIGERLHSLVIVIEPVAVGAVRIPGHCTILAALTLAPGKVRPIRTGNRARKRVTFNGDTLSLCHSVLKALYCRNIVRDLHANHAAACRAIAIRNSHGQFMRDMFIAAFNRMFLCGLSQSVGILQPAGGSIKARHHQLAFICRHRRTCQGAIRVDSHIADDNARHAIGRVNHHGSVCGYSALVLGCTICESIFPDHQHIVPCRRARERIVVGVVRIVDDRNARVFDTRHTGYHRNPMVYPVLPVISANRRKQIVLRLLSKVEADVQTVQTVDATQESCVTIDVEAAVALGSGCCGTGCRHEIGVSKGCKEVLAGDFRAFHLEARHLLLRVGGVEILQAYGGPVLKGQDKVVPVPGKERSVRGEFQYKAAVCRAGNGLGCVGLGLDKTYVGHDVLLKYEKNKCCIRMSHAN